ncbi:MAG: YheC/YheD family protein [Paenibacillus dendritiformis]|uniref:YheC/YheD family protein n=1 Tax=uncultured Paenibacillus sp. TaxID=227322 RepID=UPI0025E1335A|nr:YheC/YheD family protein [uncultured Paenibacillus sp.]MDU5144060.1 YheC/YheD family protein [Paenibacillus dendritiformis]
MRHKFINSKMLKGKPLSQDHVLSRHVPETHWYHAATLTKMLQSFAVLYIKPDKGSSGTGIIRVKRLNKSESLVSFKESSKKYPNTQIASEVAKRMHRGKKYIIQQGIPLATYRQKPFDLRIVLQKPSNQWLLTWMSAKVAPRSNSIVTNVAKGARDANIKEVLRGADQQLNVPAVLKELSGVSCKIARKMGSRFPLRIVGLDMGIDKKGKVWFIEANTRPSFHGLNKFDPVQYRRYLLAKKQTEANS